MTECGAERGWTGDTKWLTTSKSSIKFCDRSLSLCVLDGVYTDDQYERLMRVIKRNGPWPTITAHHFNTVEELMATSNGGMTADIKVTLDDLATAGLRGILGEDSVTYYPWPRIVTTAGNSSNWFAKTGVRPMSVRP